VLVGVGTGVTVGRAVAFGFTLEFSRLSVFVLLFDSVLDREQDMAIERIMKTEIRVKLIRIELFTNVLSFMGMKILPRRL